MMLKGYDSGLRSGDTESAMWCIYQYVIIQFMLGNKLATLIGNLATYGNQMKTLKRELVGGQFNLIRQAFLNLAGKDNEDTPTALHGRVVSEQQLDLYIASNVISNDGVYYSRSLLMTYFGRHMEMADLMLEIGHDYLKKRRPGTPNIMWDSFLKGVSCFHAARTTPKNTKKSRQYVKMAETIRAKVKQWKSLGNPNVEQHVELLDAEWNALKGNYGAATQHYESSILIAANGGYLHDAAFASERFGEFQLEIMEDKDSSIQCMTKSLQYWREWGAYGKASHLEERQRQISQVQARLGHQ